MLQDQNFEVMSLYIRIPVCREQTKSWNYAVHHSHLLWRPNILVDKRYYCRNKLAKEIAESFGISEGKIHTRGIWLGLLFFWLMSSNRHCLVPKSLIKKKKTPFFFLFTSIFLELHLLWRWLLGDMRWLLYLLVGWLNSLMSQLISGSSNLLHPQKVTYQSVIQNLSQQCLIKVRSNKVLQIIIKYGIL